jgi:hypothetical protein
MKHLATGMRPEPLWSAKNPLATELQAAIGDQKGTPIRLSSRS